MMIGTRIAGRYDIEEQIGIGGMGIVYRALDTRLMRRVALKVIAPHLIQQEAARTQFLREAQALAGLMHPNIVTVFDLCDDDATQTVFIVMELLRGNSLRHCLTAPDRPLFSQLALPLCRALEAAHGQGFLHRDIKPENVFVCEDGTIKLMDFGLARLLTANSHSQASLLAGTLAYMAPEQLKGAKADFRADLYSLGILFYEFLSGSTPFEADNPGAILMKHLTEAPPPLHLRVPHISPALEAVLHRLLEKEPSARFESASLLREALESPHPDGISLAQAADYAPASGPINGTPTLPALPTAETPTPVMPPPVVTRPTPASAIFRQPNGKVKPGFLVGGLACFGATALLFVGPFQRRFVPTSPTGNAHATKQEAPGVVEPAALTQRIVSLPIAPNVDRSLKAPKPSEPTPKSTGSELDELIKQQEQTRAEVERLERLVTSSEEKRKAAERRATAAEDFAAKQISKGSTPAFPQQPLVTAPGVNTFPIIPGMKPLQSTRQSPPLPLGLPDALVKIASLRPHDQFEFRTKAVTRMPDGTIQMQVHNAKPCYLYFYTLDDAKHQAVLLPNGNHQLAAAPLQNGFTGIDLRPNDLTTTPTKLLLLASVKPLFGLPPSFALPPSPKHPAGDVSSDNRFALLHDYRDQVVATLQSDRVKMNGKDIRQDDLIVRFLRDRPDRAGTPPLDQSSSPRKFGRNRSGPLGTRTP